MGLKPLQEDPCIYINDTKDAIITLYINDFIVATPTKDNVAEIKAELLTVFTLKNLGKLDKFLGYHLTDTGHSIIMAQTLYIDQVLHKQNITNCKPNAILMDPKYVHKKLYNKSESVNIRHFQQATSQLNWLTTRMRPDIAYAVP